MPNVQKVILAWIIPSSKIIFSQVRAIVICVSFRWQFLLTLKALTLWETEKKSFLKRKKISSREWELQDRTSDKLLKISVPQVSHLYRGAHENNSLPLRLLSSCETSLDMQLLAFPANTCWSICWLRQKVRPSHSIQFMAHFIWSNFCLGRVNI